MHAFRWHPEPQIAQAAGDFSAFARVACGSLIPLLDQLTSQPIDQLTN